MDQKLKDLRARCWARYTDQRESFEVKQIMLDVVKMIDATPAEPQKQERPQAVVRHYSGCKYPIIKVNGLEVVIAGEREDAEELADFINSICP